MAETTERGPLRRAWDAARFALLQTLLRLPALQFWAHRPAQPAPLPPAAAATPPARCLVYTYILDGYDELKEPDVASPRWAHYCYSDRETHSAVWQYQPIPADLADGWSPKQVASLLKIEHHRYAPADADLLITIDGSMQIHRDLDELLDLVWEDGLDMVISAHPKRDCIYDEAVAALDKGFDSLDRVAPHMWRYYLAGYPPHFGLCGTRMMIKNNRSEGLRRMCEIWGQEYRRGSCRDQLSLNYAIWQALREGIDLRIKMVDFNWLYKETGLLGIRRHVR